MPNFKLGGMPLFQLLLKAGSVTVAMLLYFLSTILNLSKKHKPNQS
jgi:hypothetical protein